MAALVSPGVSVTVTDQSFYIPAAAPTVPLLIVATRANKLQPDGITSAAGTTENNVVRTVTSIGQSAQLYGVPYFWKDVSGHAFNGDARNEYGIAALNTFLSFGNLAYVVRANVDLTDAASSFIGIGTPIADTPISIGIGNGMISEITASSPFVKLQTIDIVFNTSTAYTVQTTAGGVIGSGNMSSGPNSAMQHFVGTGNGTLTNFSFTGTAPSETWTIAFTSSTNFTVTGSVSGALAPGQIGTNYTNGLISFTIIAGLTPFAINDTFTEVLSASSTFTSSIVNFTITAGTVPFSGDDYFQFDLVYAPTTMSGFGNGAMTAITVGPSGIPETWTVTMTPPPSGSGGGGTTQFSVSGSVSGPTASGTVGVPYSNGYVTFTLTQGSTAFQSGDQFTLVLEQINLFNPLGDTDAVKRVTITTALEACINLNQDIRSDIYEYNLILCPGYFEVIESILLLADTINNEAFVIADVPCYLTPEQAAVWAKTPARASNYGVAYYYPWALTSNLDGATICVAPSGVALGVYAFSDNQSYVWFAPAGVSRGTVTGITDLGYVSGTLGTATTFVEAYLNQGQRDNLYQYYTNINPIVYFPGQGFIVWGQKTSYNATSTLDRVNAVRLVMYIKRALRKGAFPFVFEPNDAITRANLKAMADGFLNGIVAKRGLYDFVTLCDTSNNTPAIIEQNEMYMDVGIQAVIAAEFIYIPITVYSTNTTLPH